MADDIPPQMKFEYVFPYKVCLSFYSCSCILELFCHGKGIIEVQICSNGDITTFNMATMATIFLTYFRSLILPEPLVVLIQLLYGTSGHYSGGSNL